MDGMSFITITVVVTTSLTTLVVLLDLARQLATMNRRSPGIEVDWRRADAPAKAAPPPTALPAAPPPPRHVNRKTATAAYAAQARPYAGRHPHARYWTYGDPARWGSYE